MSDRDSALPYLDRLLYVPIPDSNVVFDVSPRDLPSATDIQGTLLAALQHPIGAPPLRELARPGQRVVVICDDNTRATPAKLLLPSILNELNDAGVADRNIAIIIAQGTHRPMTEDEILSKFGPAVTQRVAIRSHAYKDAASLVDYGQTRRGVRILVNRHVVEADLRIAVGNIVPHHPVGWSGGAKIVLPGVAGEETVAQMHLLGSREPGFGRVDTAMRREMEEFAARIGLSFIVNTVLNRRGDLVAVVAGHFIAAHRAGVAKAIEVYGLPIPAAADMTISCTSPIDYDFFQADKGLTAAEPATKTGGEIVLLSGCLEGISPAHPDLASYVGRCTNETIWRMLHAGQVADPLTAAEAIVINDIQERMRITLATDGLSAQECAELGFKHLRPQALGAYVEQRLRRQPDLRVGILRHSTDVLPYINGSSDVPVDC